MSFGFQLLKLEQFKTIIIAFAPVSMEKACEKGTAGHSIYSDIPGPRCEV
jgi:hypothetical protein